MGCDWPYEGLDVVDRSICPQLKNEMNSISHILLQLRQIQFKAIVCVRLFVYCPSFLLRRQTKQRVFEEFN